MKRFLFVLFGVFVVFSAVATGENIPTSRSYVDSAVAPKQDTIEHATGAPMILTNTGTAGEIGTKGIYDANGEYATQTRNLVDAATMNAGVQNAINSEFQCIEWVDPNDHSSDCLLFNIFGETERRSPNVFDSSQILKASGWIENNGVYSGQINSLYRLGRMNACSPEPCKENTQYTLSYTISVDENATPIGSVNPYLYIEYTDGTATKPTYSLLPTNPGDTSHIVLTSNSGKTVAYINATYYHTAMVHISNIQLQEGTTAMPYVPYGNIYLPAAE